MDEGNERIVLLENEIEAQLISGLLEEKGIPHVIQSYRETAYNGLFQSFRGWGHVEAPPEYREDILAIYEEIKGTQS